MKRPKRKLAWSIVSVGVMVIINLLMSISINHAEVTQNKGKDMVVRSYEIIGHLTAINPKEKWTLIDDHKWELSEDFNAKGLPSEWIKQGGYKCKNGYIVVRYYVSVRIRSEEASLNIGELPVGKKIKEVINSEEIQELFERGGKVYRIEVLPA